ncbi:aerolysin family beta-barrel pore-forming toxin [Aeromonas sp. FDAARGOS 1407]|uniref:aerolysin family beta-barrel pore-forming toxin n=1 Tax=Aeromonas TaxID=642 RepID=UPI001C214FF5|nr:aerolysin family beta-barrel pore-forming toxin [Aeromonas sp. FDAARGOS 1407]QXC35342.1 aerolysin family beta-barrel pore-forming toxin [Aeromonas sp. FDAARGOS 1407]
MKALKITGLSLIISATLATQAGAAEPIYPDQLRLFSLGEDVCGTDYRPVNREEAQSVRNNIAAMMGQWQISGLANNWVILGPGYNGEIKPGKASTTWCYPVRPTKAEIPVLSAFNIPDGDEVDVQWRLVHDSANFIKPASYLAHYLGYAWVGGDHSQFVGDDMDVTREGDDWVVSGNENGSCEGDRCKEKSSIRLNNFAYTLDPASFSHGEVTQTNRTLIKTVVGWAINDSDIEQSGYDVTLNYTTMNNWSKTNTYGLSEKVSTKNTFKWPLVGETEVSIEIAANQSWASQNGGTVSTGLSQSVRPKVPAHSKIPVKIELYKADISYPYEFKADVSYDLTLEGFLRWSGNAWHTHPGERPVMRHTFAIGPFKDKASSIRYQWDKRYIPGEMKWWDWNWAIQQNGLATMQDSLARVLRPVRASITGDFHAEGQFAGNIEIGNAVPLGNGGNGRGVNGLKLDIPLDAQELSNLGFENVTLSVTPARN